MSLLLCGLTSSSLLAGAADLPTRAVTRLKVACSTALFLGVNRGELISTGQVWVQTLGKHENISIPNPEIILVDSVRQLRDQVDNGAVDLVISSSLEYLAMQRASLLKPEITLTASPGQDGKVKYLLLVSRDGGINSLTDLKGKVLITYSRSASNLNRLWLDVTLGVAHLPPADDLFRGVSASPKPSAACLPIFFGKSDACLIDGPSWDTLRELNPQLGVKLKVLAESEPLLESLISMRTNRSEYRSEILHSIRHLQDDAEGRQVLLLFKCSRAVAIDPNDLDVVEKLRAAYLKTIRPADRKIVLPGLEPAAPLLERPKGA